jgi:hypothetical protein
MSYQNTAWTVIGMDESTGQVFVDLVRADDAHMAMALAAASASEPDSLVIVGAVEGDREVTAPGIDNGTTAFAVDLASLLQD